jgi:hypothetical protein
MIKYQIADIDELSRQLEHRDLDHAMLRRLRQVQRLCETFEIDPLIAAMLLDLTERIHELENEIRLHHNLKGPS